MLWRRVDPSFWAKVIGVSAKDALVTMRHPWVQAYGSLLACQYLNGGRERCRSMTVLTPAGKKFPAMVAPPAGTFLHIGSAADGFSRIASFKTAWRYGNFNDSLKVMGEEMFPASRFVRSSCRRAESLAGCVIRFSKIAASAIEVVSVPATTFCAAPTKMFVLSKISGLF